MAYSSLTKNGANSVWTVNRPELLIVPFDEHNEIRARDREELKAVYLLSSSFGSTSATSPNFVFPLSASSIPTIQNCSGFPARSS